MIHDYKGTFLHAASYSCLVDSALTVECYAALFAMTIARALGLKFLVLEGDSLEDINLFVNPDKEVPWSISSLIHDYFVISNSFSLIIFSHVNRFPNFVADRLAKYGAKSIAQEAWHSSPPSWLGDALYFDEFALGQTPL